MKKRGKFIVIEGIDGSGKDTQTNLLVKKLKESGYKVKNFDFPQYRKTFFGGTVGRFLKGEFGSLNEVNPYLASIVYAGDRWQAKDEINKYLGMGYVVVSNRYVLSNLHQASKLKGKRRKEFWDFNENLEYKTYGIPKEDLDLILDVPVAICKKLILKKRQRKYLGKKRKKDIAESDFSHQNESRKVYLAYARSHKSTLKITCFQKGILLSPERIHKIIWEKVKPLL